MVRSFAFATLLFALVAAAPAADVPPADTAAIRAVITEQLDAFARDDAPRAFALASSGIRERFGSPGVFMDMVRAGYPVVYRPKVALDGVVIGRSD